MTECYNTKVNLELLVNNHPAGANFGSPPQFSYSGMIISINSRYSLVLYYSTVQRVKIISPGLACLTGNFECIMNSRTLIMTHSRMKAELKRYALCAIASFWS